MAKALNNATTEDCTQKNLETDLRKAQSAEDINEVKLKYLGRKGIIAAMAAQIKDIEPSKRGDFGIKLNLLKNTVTNTIIKAENDTLTTNKSEDINKTAPVVKTNIPSLHPTTQTLRDLNDFFKYYGFSVLEGPEIEDDFHNFEMMGVPKDHPARELQDTLYIKEPNILLRTQTSNEEARVLKRENLPIRVVIPGKVFRNETANKTNGAVFYQYQGVYVDKNVTMGNLKWMFERALKHILGEDTKIRFRSKYYPEVEPGLSPDIQCKFCQGKGCNVCKHRGWVEIAGGGMIHPTTLQKAGIDNKKYSGFAFGWGIDRVVMNKYKINDQRLLYTGNLIYK